MFKYKEKQLVEGIAGSHYIFKFDNKHGASVVSESSHYSTPLFELATIRFEGEDDYLLDFTNSITTKVIRKNTVAEINNLLDRIKDLEEVK